MKYNPPAGSQDPDAKYVTGQPGKVRGSAVPAEAVEHPQREIVEVIRQAGLEPSGDDLGQLWKALQQLFTEKVAVATKEKAGIVKPGSGLSVKGDGTLDVTVSAAIPGTIVAFAGTFGGEGNRHPIPLGGSEPDTGWVLCDGGSDGKGGTVPDLRGRMIMGVSDAYKAGSTEGDTIWQESPLSLLTASSSWMDTPCASGMRLRTGCMRSSGMGRGAYRMAGQ